MQWSRECWSEGGISFAEFVQYFCFYYLDKCELCSTKYVFLPEYAKDTPSVVPYPLIIKSAAKIFVFKILPGFLKIAVAICLWLLFVPLWTSWVYRIYFREQTYKDVIIARSSFRTIWNDIISGLVIIGVILLSSIILVRIMSWLKWIWLTSFHSSCVKLSHCIYSFIHLMSFKNQFYYYWMESFHWKEMSLNANRVSWYYFPLFVDRCLLLILFDYFGAVKAALSTDDKGMAMVSQIIKWI